MGNGTIQYRQIDYVIFSRLLNINNRTFALCFCHQIKERSIWCFGLEHFLCSRCLGILFGGTIGLAFVLFQYRIGIVWALILMLPLIIDGCLQALHYRESNNILRLTKGFLFGVGLQFFMAIVMSFFTKWKFRVVFTVGWERKRTRYSRNFRKR